MLALHYDSGYFILHLVSRADLFVLHPDRFLLLGSMSSLAHWYALFKLSVVAHVVLSYVAGGFLCPSASVDIFRFGDGS
jgi:hypothetical protein